jgi:hypothetical protein
MSVVKALPSRKLKSSDRSFLGRVFGRCITGPGKEQLANGMLHQIKRRENDWKQKDKY